MKICGLLDPDHIFLDLTPGDKESVLREFVKALKQRGFIEDEAGILAEILRRESLGSTGLERGIAIPHVLTDQFERSFLALAVFKTGIDFQAADQTPTYILMLLLGNKREPGSQLKILAHVCRLVKETDIIARIKKSDTASEICRALQEEEAKII